MPRVTSEIHKPTASWLKTRTWSSAPAGETLNSTTQNSSGAKAQSECFAPVPIHDFVRRFLWSPSGITESDAPKPLHRTNTRHRARQDRIQPFEQAGVRLPTLPQALRHLP